MNKPNQVDIRSILFFETMITPKILTFLYWIAMIALFVVCIGMAFFGDHGRFSTAGYASGFIIFVIGSILIRVVCELLIVVFTINENLQRVSDLSRELTEQNEE